MVLGLVPDALEKRNLSSKSFVNFCELFVASSVEREMGLEPTTTCLEGRGSTTELLPRPSQPILDTPDPRVKAPTQARVGATTRGSEVR